MKLLSPSLSLLFLGLLSPLAAQDLPVVPYPKRVDGLNNQSFVLKNGFTISAPASFLPAAELLMGDLGDLYQIKASVVQADAAISFEQCPSMKQESYELVVSPDGVRLKAADYNSMMFAVTSLMQMIRQGEQLSIPCCRVIDTPSFGYRTFMLDVARQVIDVETVKQIIDLCRWYKVRYMQFHLTDDQLFTFESKLYPKLTEGKAHYTQEQLKDIVAYATQLGVIIIPEFDVPGHSGALRRAMPEVFGAPNLGMIDVIKPECVKAVKEIMKEMMDIFYTSPYFHIGADEVSIANYQRQQHVVEYLEKNKDKADDAHDLFLQFIVEMHDFVKSCGKKTMAWESFKNDGSDKVKIPKDLCVHVFGTVRALPHELIAEGYTIVNSTFKPWYMIPNLRWSAESIYTTNARHWENFHDKAPSYHTPFQLPNNDQILGVQMCSWEMNDQDQVSTAHDRIAAFSETAWNDDVKENYTAYKLRADQADAMVMRLLFPAEEIRSGFKAEDVHGIHHNKINNFGHEGRVFFKPLNPQDTVHYTTNRSFPTIDSPQLIEPLTLNTNSKTVRYAIYSNKGVLRGYKAVTYDLAPIDASFTGDLLPVRDRYFSGVKIKENFCNDITMTLTNAMPDTELFYTTDGSTPTRESIQYTGPVTFKDTVKLFIVALNKKGSRVGAWYRCTLCKKDRNAPID